MQKDCIINLYTDLVSPLKKPRQTTMYYNMGEHVVVRDDVTTWNPRFPPRGTEHLSAVIRTVLITLLGKTELRHSSFPGSAARAADPSFPSCSPQSRETRLKAEAQPKN